MTPTPTTTQDSLSASPPNLEPNENHATDVPERSHKPKDSPRPVNITRFLMIAAALFYCVAAFKISVSKEPFIDEGWLASPAYNLAFHGFMGTTVLEPTGSWLIGSLTGIHQYTYWVMPLHLVAQAAWYRIFGFGLFQMRLMSMTFGAIALAAWYFIVERITRNSFAGALTILLLSVDFTFLWSAADGRMDMMCVGLGSAALATFLVLREKHFQTALLCANCLAAASVFTHPNGVAWVCFLAILVVLYDRRGLRPRHLAAGIPYAVFLAGWAWYIAKRPDYFRAQFVANLHFPGGTRGSGFLHPLTAIQKEVQRYIQHYGVGIWVGPMPRFAILIPILFSIICVAALIQFLRTREKGLGIVLLLLATCLGLMTFGDSLKAHAYLGMILPLYAATAAVWFSVSGFKGLGFYLRCGLIVCLLFLQVDLLNEKLVFSPLRENFEPTVAFLKSIPNARITADSVFAFELGYGRINDDMRLGMRSGRKPDVIVVDRWYYLMWRFVFPDYDPRAVTYVHNLIDNHYHPVFSSGSYIVYERNTSSSDAPAQSPILPSGNSLARPAIPH